MSAAMDCALSLVREFHKAQYLDDVDPKNIRALAVLMDKILPDDEAEHVLKILAGIDPKVRLSDVSFETINNDPSLSKAEAVRLVFWGLAVSVALMQVEGHTDLTPDEIDETARELAEDIREDMEAADPAFARYVFGRSRPPGPVFYP